MTPLVSAILFDRFSDKFAKWRSRDERNLFEFTHPDHPGERLVACRNRQLADYRAHKREALLQATERQLEKVRAAVTEGRLSGQDKIGVREGRVVNQYKVAKHFDLEITDARFSYARNAERIATEAAVARQRRTRLPHTEGRRSEDPAHPSSPRGSRACPHRPWPWISSCIKRSARKAACSGLKGAKPAAFKSASTKFGQAASSR